MKNNTLHEWFYNIMCIICLDRDYLYFLFVRHFNGFMKEIFERGNVEDSGSFIIMGMKSGLKCILEWKLEHRINFVGGNIIFIRCTVRNNTTEYIEEQLASNFDLSSGEILEY